MRIIASDGPPAENGTTMVTGCDGNLSAAGAQVVNVISNAQAARSDLSIPFSQRRNIVIASEAKQSTAAQERKMDCFVASLLAMTK
jgi:hypothetical protein